MKKEGQKAPSIDDLKEASSEDEFKARLKEGQAFRLKEKAGCKKRRLERKKKRAEKRRMRKNRHLKMDEEVDVEVDK